MGWRRILSRLAFGGGLLALAACDVPLAPSTKPQARPAPPPPAAVRTTPSSRSQQLALFYRREQANLLTRGLLRTDGGGVDTPFTDEDLARNFERIAFFNEDLQAEGLQGSGASEGRLRKWVQPVRMQVAFGAQVPEEERRADAELITAYANRLARVTGHPISTVQSNANFHVFIVGEDDRPAARDRAVQIIPSLSRASIDFIDRLDRSTFCFVITTGKGAQPFEFTQAIAFVRAEHPPLMKESCIHEELAQGLGLTNDSPRARPSIFNDDEEFALLTSHDEILLSMLYDPALAPGMSLDEARPIIRRLIAARLGPS